MTLRVHLVSSETPLESYKDVKVACGQVLKDADCVAMVNSEFATDGTTLFIKNGCRKCREWRDAQSRTRENRYVYALVSAQEMKLQAGTYLSEGDIA